MVVGKFRQVLELGKKAFNKMREFLPQVLKVYHTVAPAVKKALPGLAPIIQRTDEIADIGESLNKSDFNEAMRKMQPIKQRFEKHIMGQPLAPLKKGPNDAFIKLSSRV